MFSHFQADIMGDPVCIICKSCQDGSLKLFTDQTWSVVKRTAEYRRMKKSDNYKHTTSKVSLLQQAVDAYYHPQCYKKYTAVKKPVSDIQGDSPTNTPSTQCRITMPPSDEKGLLKGACIFCPILRKTINR